MAALVEMLGFWHAPATAVAHPITAIRAPPELILPVIGYLNFVLGVCAVTFSLSAGIQCAIILLLDNLWVLASDL